MAIKTGRTDERAEVFINYDLCTKCGLCTRVCKGGPLYKEGVMVKIDQSRGFGGCFGCGQCVAVCPNNCITVTGRTLSKDDFLKIAGKTKSASFDELFTLMNRRRSIREYKKENIKEEDIIKILNAVSTAPMGIPPSDVEVIVFKGREKVQKFADDIVNSMFANMWIFGPFMRTLMIPFVGKEFAETSKTFLEPLIKEIKYKRDKGVDLLFYNAPLLMYFHTSVYSDPVDPLISATYAMLAAESLGLGSCMIGTPAQFIKYSKKLKKRYHIPDKNHQGITVLFGYPAIRFNKTIRRSIANIYYY